METQEFRVRDDRDLSPLVQKLRKHGASTVFTLVQLLARARCLRLSVRGRRRLLFGLGG